MLCELFLVRVQRVQAAIEPVVIDSIPRHAQQILQRGAPIPAFGHAQFARLGAEASHGEQAGDPFPGHFFAARRHQFIQ